MMIVVEQRIFDDHRVVQTRRTRRRGPSSDTPHVVCALNHLTSLISFLWNWEDHDDDDDDDDDAQRFFIFLFLKRLSNHQLQTGATGALSMD